MKKKQNKQSPFVKHVMKNKVGFGCTALVVIGMLYVALSTPETEEQAHATRSARVEKAQAAMSVQAHVSQTVTLFEEIADGLRRETLASWAQSGSESRTSALAAWTTQTDEQRQATLQAAWQLMASEDDLEKTSNAIHLDGEEYLHYFPKCLPDVFAAPTLLQGSSYLEFLLNGWLAGNSVDLSQMGTDAAERWVAIRDAGFFSGLNDPSLGLTEAEQQVISKRGWQGIREVCLGTFLKTFGPMLVELGDNASSVNGETKSEEEVMGKEPKQPPQPSKPPQSEEKSDEKSGEQVEELADVEELAEISEKIPQMTAMMDATKATTIFTSSNFQQQLQAKRHSLVVFSTPSSSRESTQFQQFFFTAGTIIGERGTESNKDATPLDLTMGMVDCAREKELCGDIRSFPSAKYYRDGAFVEDFNEAWTMHGIFKFLNDKVGGLADEEGATRPLTWTEEDKKQVVQMTEATFQTGIQVSNALVMFYAPWCAKCKRFKGVFLQAALTLNEQFTFGVVDISTQSKTVQDNGVSSFPTLLLFSHGKRAGVFDGEQTLMGLVSWLTKQIASKTEL